MAVESLFLGLMLLWQIAQISMQMLRLREILQAGMELEVEELEVLS